MSGYFGKSAAFIAFVVAAALTAGAAFADDAAPPAAPNAPAPTVANAPPPDDAAAKPKPKKKVPPSVVVVVTNSRAVALKELEATGDGGKPKTILSDLAPGKKKSVKVVHGKSCVFDLHGTYADGSTSDSASVDLCKDKSVNLVD